MFTTSVLQCYYCFYNLSICCCCICTTSLLHAYYLLLGCYYFFTTCLLLVTTCSLLLYCMFATFYLFTTFYYFCDTALLLLTTFYYFVPRFANSVYFYGQTPPLVLVPSIHYYLGSLSWTSRTFYFPDSRYLLEVLGDFLGRERERGGSLGDPPGP